MKNLTCRFRKALAATVMLVAAQAASAGSFDVTYNSTSITFGGTPVSLALTLTTAGSATTFEQVTGLSGTVTVGGVTNSIDGLIPLASFGNDNLFKLTPDYVSFSGLGFYYDDAGSGERVAWSLYTQPAGVQNLYGGSVDMDWNTLTDISLSTGTVTAVATASAVPEPSSTALLLAGLSFVGVASQRRKRFATRLVD